MTARALLGWMLCGAALGVGCTCRMRSDELSPPVVTTPHHRIDVHQHVQAGAGARAVQLLDAWGIDVAVNLSGGWPGHGLEESLAEAARHPGRFVVFATPPLSRVRDGPAGVASLVHELRLARALGARGLKIFKALGLSVTGPDGALLAVDDPLLDPLFDEAGALGMPVSLHTGDPVAFWQPATAENERFDELSVHPGWSYAGKAVPSWEALFQAYERRVARHPKTTFIGVHFGNAPEDPARVFAMLEKYPNLFVDTAARVPELGRRDVARLRELFLRYPDRVLFGTDVGVGPGTAPLMLGSTGAEPPGPREVAHFFTSTWRFFETGDRRFAHPTPVQGRWTIDGLALPPEVLAKVYFGNAARLLGLAAR